MLSRFSSVTNGPLNYGAIFVWVTFGFCLMTRLQFDRRRDALYFNAQDNPEFWFQRYNMMFPPSFLHDRISAHYIEINHIFAIEMMKKYQGARREVLAERETHSDEVKRTKYATNPNYVYEAFGSKDDDKIKRMKDAKMF